MTKTEISLADGDTATRLGDIQAQLDAAMAAEVTAQDAASSMDGMHMLGEASDDDKTLSQEALSNAQRHTASLRSAIGLLRQREKAQEVASAAARVERLRMESASAQAAQTAAMSMVSKASADLSDALDTVRAQDAILSGIHTELAESDPERAEQVDQDYRDALAMIGTTFAQKQSEVRSMAASAQYRLQNTSGGDPTVETEILLADGVGHIATGTPFSVARGLVLDAQVTALAQLDQEMREAQEDAYQDHCARTETSGLGLLPASRNEIRAASNLNPEAVGLLLDDAVVRSLIGLTGFLPASSTERIAVRSVPRSALEARQEDEKLRDGLVALRALAAN